MIKYSKTITLRYAARDSVTGKKLNPGDKVRFYPAYYFWKRDEETGKKMFLNRYELVRRAKPEL